MKICFSIKKVFFIGDTGLFWQKSQLNEDDDTGGQKRHRRVDDRNEGRRQVSLFTLCSVLYGDHPQHLLQSGFDNRHLPFKVNNWRSRP